MTMTVKTEWHGPVVTERERVGAAKGLFLAAENILEMATRIVPLNEGTLERSGAASVDEAKLVAAVSYDTPYAVRQHEELDYNHPNGRQSKYLETPLNAEREQCNAIIAAEIRAALR